MKKFMKSLAGLMLALAMMLSTATTALAASTVTINDYTSGETYVAYKLMDVTNSGTNYSYTVVDAYSTLLQSVTNQTTDAGVINYLSGLSSNSTQMKTIANSIYSAIQADSSITETAIANSASGFTQLENGYYLIVQTSVASGNNQVYTSAILTTITGDTTITTKKDNPELVKKVKETNDTTGQTTDWQDAADYDIGDDVPFQLTATLPSNYSDYTTYKLVFHDTLSNGLTFNDDVKVYVDGTELVDSDYSVLVQGTDTLSDTNCSFEVVINNLKSLSTSGVTVTSTSKIVVEYTAKLNSAAVIGSTGNPNKAYLEYSNNPYNANNTSTTPEDKVTVFTYKLVVDKVDKDGDAVTGAEFTLYKLNSNNTYDQVAVLTSTTKTFTYSGLDAGTYKIEETKVPDGYTKAEDIVFDVAATYTGTADNPSLLTLTVTVTSGTTSIYSSATADLSSGTIDMDVINTSTSELPGTGGMGTTMFYVLGGLMVAGAGIALISKKRMEKELESK
ncbi:MAG: isopeptide-forming domain-containing fimbrial protein [Erysipelotrichaceae bacterium]|nr:isopeptide-forming domain-containing fimbrial protein [Erysipelotrichaceae bacterium]